MAKNNGNREQWNSRVGFILATVGSAVGLGNIWRFPTMAAQSGGGAFVAVYLLAAAVIGLPLIMAELAMGRSSQRNAISTFKFLRPGRHWWIVGVIATVAVFLILSFYTVIAGWTLIYTILSLGGTTAGLDAGGLAGLFVHLTENTLFPLLGQAVFIFIALAIVIVGVTDGIERWGKLLMPGVIILLLVLLIRTFFLEGALEGVRWFLRPDFARLTFPIALEAVGQVFFSFSLGMGAILTYGSYLSRNTDIPANSTIITVVDVGIAILAGLIVIPALFAFGVEPEIGPGLVFVTLPAVFNTLPGAAIWSALFFLSLSFAALTSIVSLMEVLNAILIEEKKWPRQKATAVMASLIFVAGAPSALAHGLLQNVLLFGLDIFSFVDFFASNILLPISGLFTAIFVAWIWGVKNAISELETGAAGFKLAPLWSALMLYLIPLILIYIFISGIIS